MKQLAKMQFHSSNIVFQSYKRHNIYFHKAKMTAVQSEDLVLHSPENLELAPLSISEGAIQERVVSQPKNKRWTDSQHARYILFLELNRQKIKSKLIRRSSSFYLQMAAFIKGKNGVQCRSHHQKYEARYKYPHRIIREEKGKLDKQLYNDLKSSYSIQPHPMNSNHIVLAQHSSILPKTQKDPMLLQSISCQTEIQGLNQVFVEPDHLNNYAQWLYQYYHFPPVNQGQYLMDWRSPYPLLQPASPYFTRPF